MNYKRFLFAAGLFLLALSASAQSLSYAKNLIDQGQYREAAMELRPLADGGDAEAQYLAATLFFAGNGVNQSDQQGIKYATMAADQGNEDAMMLLAKKVADDKALFELAQKYCTMFPEKIKTFPGLILAKCYLEGAGVEQDLEKGLEIYENNEYFEENMKDPKAAYHYWTTRMQLSGKDCLEDYADYLYAQKDVNRYKSLERFITSVLYRDGEHGNVSERAEQGNPWAMAALANGYIRVNPDKALSLATKATDAGSAYGREVYRKITYVPQTYGISRTQSSTSTSTDVLKIEQGYDYTKVYFCYHQRGFSDWVATGKNTYLMHNGKKYKLLRTTLPMLPDRKKVTPGEAVDYSWTFERIPDDAETFTIVEDGDKYGFRIEK